MSRRVIAIMLLGWSVAAFAQSRSACSGPQLGTWKLQSFTTTYVDNGQSVLPYGSHPSGYLNYGSDCRMYAIIVREGRVARAGIVPTDSEKIALFNGVLAYAGTYTIDHNTVSHEVDISWNEAWTGTNQVRQFRIEGKTLHIQSAVAKNPRDGRLSSAVLVWTKVE